MFKPFQFLYKKPPTVPAPLRVQVVTKAAPLSSRQQQTVAGKLISDLSNLIDTSSYLQQLVLNRCAGSGPRISKATDPDLAAALRRIYQAKDDVPGITVEMYSNLLDAELTHMQLDMQLGKDNANEPSPYELADLIAATKAFESSMIGSLEYRNELAPLLRSLKGDQVIFRNLQTALAQYPAVRNAIVIGDVSVTHTVNSTLDMSDQLASVLVPYVDNQSGIYARMFNLMSTSGHVEADIENIANMFFYQPIEDLVRMAAAYNALKSLVHGMSLQGLADDLTNFMFVRLLSQVGNFATQLDRMFNQAIAPLKGSVNSVAKLAQRVQGIGSDVGYVMDGGLKGMIQGNACQKSKPVQPGQREDHHRETPADKAHNGKVETAWNDAFGSVTKGINSLASHLNWATNAIDQKNSLIQDSLRKLANRRIGDQSDRLELLCSMQALDSLIALTKSFASEIRTNSAPRTAQQQVEAMGRILTNLRSPSASSLSIQDGQVQITPPTIPAVPDNVNTVLVAGGLDRVTSRDMAQVEIGASV